MSTSVDRTLLKHCLGYAAVTAVTALFGAVYERFSHEVYSYFMLYAFAIPLLLGLCPLLLAAVSGKTALSGWSLRLYNSGVAALTVGSLFEGVLQIYGTTNRLVIVYPLAGGALIAAGLAVFWGSRHIL